MRGKNLEVVVAVRNSQEKRQGEGEKTKKYG
jgi:hypothetical protein